IAAGVVAGGVFPVAMALTADLVPVHQRQVAIGRLLAVGLTGNMLGSSIAGVIGAAASLHSCSFYLGQAVGPVVYAVSFAQVGAQPSLLVGALVVLTVGLVCSRLL